jgi:hypothetical protein
MYKIRSIQRILVCLVIVSIALAFVPISISAAEEQLESDQQDAIIVHLTGGRTMSAMIDPRTDGRQLWLRWESARAELLRPIDWDSVAAAEIIGEKITGQEFLDLVNQIRRDVPAQSIPTPVDKIIAIMNEPFIEPVNSEAAFDNQLLPDIRQVQWLDIYAVPSKWDNYVETDGMTVFVVPKNTYGEVIPVRGTLDVDLIAEHAGVVRLPDPFQRIAHWSQAVSAEDFGPYGAAYQLPFQDLNPDFSRDLGPHGAIHAVLSIPGQGTFESTNDARIRPYSLIRDRLQQTTGQRFFPEETIGRPWER